MYPYSCILMRLTLDRKGKDSFFLLARSRLSKRIVRPALWLARPGAGELLTEFLTPWFDNHDADVRSLRPDVTEK